ncbi:Permease YjgP/YjgQ [hydrothermal vent metagenome]|uniref:Permease YjgP/YjgQ n=1 Tax=hydrothermal vent metagenome TaxID=652676 RepID=A0A1W1C103_9ZZZZ
MLAFRYVLIHYMKFFIIIVGALSLFLVGFDYMSNASKISSSANLVLIYLAYKSLFAIDMLLPLSLIFAMISTKISLIRSNALIAFYSLGYSKMDILKPFIVASMGITMIFIYLHTLPRFAKANEMAENIKDHSEYLSPTRDLFFIYKKQYIYFSKLLPLQQKAVGVRIFRLKDKKLHQVIIAKSAFYKNGAWHIKNADIITKPDDFTFDSKGIKVTRSNDVILLEGFRPKILDQVYEGKANYTILDAFEALTLLSNQDINIDKIKSAIYKNLIYPFYAPLLVIILFFFVPISSRFLNVSLFSFVAIVSTLLIWGVLFMLMELAKNKTISSEVGIVLPIFLLFIVALTQLYRNRT